jgi:hypothetical protein
MARGRADAAASGRLLAATLQAFDGDRYRSNVDAVVWATVSAVIGSLPTSGSLGPHRRRCWLPIWKRKRLGSEVGGGRVLARPPEAG